MKINPDARVHYLKTWPEFFQAVKKGKKKFEMRYNDRDYKVNDILCLQEYNPDIEAYTDSNDIYALVTYTLEGKPFVPEEYICMSINVLK